MKIGQATGFQVVFLMYAVMLLAVPLSDYILGVGAATGATKAFIGHGTQFALAAAVILVFPNLRRFAWAELSTPLPQSKRAEVALVTVAKLPLAFAGVATFALWVWATQGPAGVEQVRVDVDREAARAFSSGVPRFLLTVLVGPIIEEIVCRGFIYRAFERQWGWFASMLLTSVVFGLYHSHFWSAFLSSIVFVCVLRRTGSLWAPIVVHTVFNLSIWWPLMGQFVFPQAAVLSDLSPWRFHIACVAFVAIALPVYLWFSRDRYIAARSPAPTANAALSH